MKVCGSFSLISIQFGALEKDLTGWWCSMGAGRLIRFLTGRRPKIRRITVPNPLLLRFGEAGSFEESAIET